MLLSFIMPPKVLVSGHQKCLSSPEINYIFDMRDGFHAVWGKTPDDNPEWSVYGPFIADIEITTACHGVNGKLCDYCYKANTPDGRTMSLSTFQRIIRNINFSGQLTQVAFGLDAAAESNTEVWAMGEWLRSCQVIPNGTVAAVSESTAENIAALWGACAVSFHGDKAVCYDTIALLTNKIHKPGKKLRQVNMHLVLYEEMYQEALGILNDIQNDPRLARLNAIVFLSLKQKGRAATRKTFTPMSQERYNNIINHCLAQHISFGSDSCGCHKAAKALHGRMDEHRLASLLEPCEGMCMSAYSNVDGMFYPCSFLENDDDTCGNTPSFNLLDGDFSSFWLHDPRVIAYRDRLIKHHRQCPQFVI